MHPIPSISRIIGLAALTVAIGICTVQAQGYLNFIRQHQQGTNVVWQMPVAPSGASPAALVTEEGGALFQLWTISQTTAAEYLLDQKLVGAYLPKATITIRTQDSYNGIPRIRVDQPFAVDFNVSNLIFGNNLPASASKVLAEHHLVSNPIENNSITPAQAISGTPYSSGYIGVNGTTSVQYAASSIRHTNPLKARGEEHFVIHALADGSYSQTQLATAFLRVCPIATGSISGIVNGSTLRGNPPPITVKIEDLYPCSETFLRIHSNGPALGPEGTKIPGSILVLDQEFPKNPDPLLVSDYGRHFDSDGAYRIDLITVTPFGSERLDTVSFNVNRTMRIHAMQVDGEIITN